MGYGGYGGRWSFGGRGGRSFSLGLGGREVLDQEVEVVKEDGGI